MSHTAFWTTLDSKTWLWRVLGFYLIRKRCERLLPAFQSWVTGSERVKSNHAPVTVSLSLKTQREHAYMDEIKTNEIKEPNKLCCKMQVFKERPKSNWRQGLATYHEWLHQVAMCLLELQLADLEWTLDWLITTDLMTGW